MKLPFSGTRFSSHDDFDVFVRSGGFSCGGGEMTIAKPPAFNLAVSTPIITTTSKLTYPQPKGNLLHIFGSTGRRNSLRLVGCGCAVISRTVQDAFDPELRLVLELATDSELFEIENILFGPSYFSPLLKSITNGANVDYAMIDKDLQEREEFIAALESRFLFLAADARSTLRGWRPSYRNVLLAVRKELNIPCSSKLSTEDLEAEIFLHLLQDNSGEESGNSLGLLEFSKQSNQASLELGLNQRKVQAFSTLKDFWSVILKGGSMITLANIYQLVSKRLTWKVFLEAANYQMKRELIRKGGQLAAINLESRAGLLAAKQGFAGAASRYLGVRSMMALLGPVLWGTLLADVVIQMLGTDYARILRAIYAFAQIRIIRTHKLPSDDS
ncbi:hypothetical protein FNV43_RR21081 [Rhamnella rubrinervis]|uniref:Uncharacterized protein n=1 Tax=Rhamnella rubrinervis TaxID=2594499 RepID=A0A8K0E2E2_9ROSA|nr:hypothetical protein FNV43_RR21081 [Rhamnella rubrinervis]